MATALFTLEEATTLQGRAFERVVLEVLIRNSNLCDLHRTQLRGRLDTIEASADLGLILPGCVLDQITAIDYNGGNVLFKTRRFPDTFATLADIAGRQKPQDSTTEAMYFIHLYHAFNTKLLQVEREAGSIRPGSVLGPVTLSLWHVIGGSRYTIEQFSAGRSIVEFVRMHSTRCAFLANRPPHNDFVPQCSCPDSPQGEAAAGGVNETVVQAVVRGLAAEIWNAMAFQRRRNAVVNNFVNLSVEDFLALFHSALVKAALATLEQDTVAPPPYPGHPGLQPGEVQEISPEVSPLHVDIDWILDSLRSLLV